MLKKVFLFMFVGAALGAIIGNTIAWAVSTTNPPPIKEQYPGHISGNDLRNGITTFDMKVHGEWVSCIYASGTGSSGGFSGGVALSCDWNNQRR